MSQCCIYFPDLPMSPGASLAVSYGNPSPNRGASGAYLCLRASQAEWALCSSARGVYSASLRPGSPSLLTRGKQTRELVCRITPHPGGTTPLIIL